MLMIYGVMLANITCLAAFIKPSSCPCKGLFLLGTGKKGEGKNVRIMCFTASLRKG